MHKNTVTGLIAVLGIWLCAGFALPLINVLKMFSPEQLLVVRGFLTAFIVFFFVREKVFKVDKYAMLVGLTVPLASLGLFKGVREWGASPTIIVVTATPLINFLITAFGGKKIPLPTLLGFGLVFAGVVIACGGGHFDPTGFFWAAFGTVANGILYEFVVRTKSTPFQVCFWGSIGIGLIGLLFSYNANWAQVETDPRLALYLLGYAVLHGIVYWMANLVAFKNLPKDATSVLAQGETPAVILVAGVLLGEKLSALQWFGVILALFGAFYLGKWLAKAHSEEARNAEAIPA